MATYRQCSVLDLVLAVLSVLYERLSHIEK
jgi:hypothetical protein